MSQYEWSACRARRRESDEHALALEVGRHADPKMEPESRPGVERAPDVLPDGSRRPLAIGRGRPFALGTDPEIAALASPVRQRQAGKEGTSAFLRQVGALLTAGIVRRVDRAA